MYNDIRKNLSQVGEQLAEKREFLNQLRQLFEDSVLNLQGEIWKDIPKYNNYQVSNFGRVKSLERQVTSRGGVRTIPEKILSNNLTKAGYEVVSISLNNGKKQKVTTVHQLMAMAFLDHEPNGHTIVVDHINGMRTDNRIENLQLISHGENIKKGYEMKREKAVIAPLFSSTPRLNAFN